MNEKRYPEVTTSSMVFGIVIGILMNASITYAGLKIGFTITGSAIAAVLGFGVLRGVLRRGSILEVNIAQTVASTVNTTTSGIIFTVPVLFLLEHPLSLSDPKLWIIGLAGTAGAVMGCALIVPLRKQMIEIDRLPPSGVALGTILRSPGSGGKKSLVLVAGVIMAAVLYFPTLKNTLENAGLSLPGYEDLDWRLSSDSDGDGARDLVLEGENFYLGRLLGVPSFFALTLAIAPLSFGAGYLSGRPGLMVLAGCVLAYEFLAPVIYLSGYMPPSVADFQVAEAARMSFNRPIGIGMLLGGALVGVISALPALRAAIKSIASASRNRQGKEEMGVRALLATSLPCIAILFFAMHFSRDPTDTTGLLSGLPFWLQNVAITAIGSVWIWFAGIIIAQCTGMTDWSPISGMALLTVVLVMTLGGKNDAVGAVLVGATLCVAVTAAADMMTDLKTGQLIGALPYNQQITQTLTAAIGPLVSLATLLLIVHNNTQQYGIPIGPGTPTSAPQADALRSVVEGVRGGSLPYALYGSGAAFGALLGLGSFPGLGVLVGLSMYLPFKYILTYGVGCLAQMIVAKIKGNDWSEEWGLPLCAGLVVGEAMLALTVSGILLITG